MRILNVLTEYLENPIGIDIVSPRINWTLGGVEKQDSYEIVYSVSGIEKTTGVIASSSMHHDFKEEFSSRDRVEFVIKVRSGNNEIVSEKNSFEMGLIDQSEWKASWISGNYKPNKKDRYPVDCFRKEFDAKSIKKARLYISALGVYEASINGERVGSFIMAPGSTDYRKRVQYQVYDVTSLLKDGTNELSLLLGDGWYRGSIGAKGMRCIFGKQTALLAQLEMEDNDGNVSCVLTDSSFSWSNDGPYVFSDFKDGEVVDNRKEATYKGHAIEVEKNVNLSSGNNRPAEEHEYFSPISETISKSGRQIFEFKQNLAGYISFEVDAHEGDAVDIVLGEMLDENGEVTLKNVQCVHKGKRTPLQEVHLICKEGHNSYHAKFMYAGFKFASVSGAKLNKENIKQIAVYTDMPETSTFDCSNELINIFYRNTLWSLKSNSLDVPTDCPTRERMGWTGDSQVFFNSATYLTNYAAFSRKHLVDVFDRQDKNGRLPQIAPYNAEDWFMDVMNGSVGWADVGVLIPYRFYKQYGDKRLLEKYYDDMMRYAQFMIKRCGRPKGIYSLYAKPLHLSKENAKYGVNTGQSYGEWAEPNDVKAVSWLDFCEPHPEESMAYTSYILSLMEEISRLLGKEENISHLHEYSEGVKSAYRELITKEKFSIDTDRQAKLVRPLYMHLLDEKTEEFAKARLIKALENYRWRLGTGFLSTPFILDVLASYDVEAAYRLLENEEMPGWLYMSKHNTGTIWEGWEGPTAQLGISSLNHYSKGALVEWLFHSMCGINIAGDNRFELTPCIGGKETYAKASYRSIYGEVSLSWKKEDGHVSFEIEVPGNTVAEFAYLETKKTLTPGKHSFSI